MDRRIESAPVTPPSPPVLPSTPSTPSTPVTAAPSNGLFDDLDIDEHVRYHFRLSRRLLGIFVSFLSINMFVDYRSLSWKRTAIVTMQCICG